MGHGFIPILSIAKQLIMFSFLFNEFISCYLYSSVNDMVVNAHQTASTHCKPLSLEMGADGRQRCSILCCLPFAGQLEDAGMADRAKYRS